MVLGAMTAVSAGTTGAQTSAPVPTAGNVMIYGRLGLTMESVRTSRGASATLQRLSASRSVLGFRGQEDLGGGLYALFQVEGAVAADTGAGSLANRDTRVGLQGKWGTLFFGHWLTPYASSTAGLDPFFTLPVGFSNLMGNGVAPSTDNTGNLSAFDRRQANIVQFHSPVIRGFSLQVAVTPKEESERRPGLDPWLASVAASHSTGPWTTTLAWERHSDYQAAGTRDDGVKLGLSWRDGPWRLAGLVERLRYGTAGEELQRDAWFLSASYGVGPGRWILNLAQAGDGSGPFGSRVGAVTAGADTGARQVTAGYEYALSRRTSLHAYGAWLRNDNRGRYDLTLGPLGIGEGASLRTVALGMRTSF